MKKLSAIILFIILLTSVLSGCSAKLEQGDDKKINIVATIFPEYDFARAIVGDKANVQLLIQPGSSVHSFDPSPSDMVKAQKADVFIFIGGESDIWVEDRLLDSLDTSKMIIIRLIDHIDMLEEEIKEGMEVAEYDAGDGDELEYDEHIWTSPKNAIKLIDVICDGICEKDAENADTYKANAKKYQDDLKAVDAEIADAVANAKRDKIIVADKFPFLYFVNAYGLDYEAAFPGCSDQADAGAKAITHLVNAVKSEDIPYIYYVELSNKSVAAAISEQTGAEALLLNSCHNVSNTDFNNGITYLDLMKHNVESLKKGLN
ncbi:MAG: metal ABC transporter substrate-binding protein [Oscillospiraceae bacterium]|nr:metal ABC transporter substrate-binding protein [Oscillospiraceae bacterium]